MNYFDYVVVVCFPCLYLIVPWDDLQAGCFAWFVFLLSRGGVAALPRGAVGLSVVCDCGIS